MARKSVKYLTEKEIQELVFRENSDEDVDHVEAEVMYDSDSDKDYIPEPSDDDDEDDSDGTEPSTSSHKRKKIQHRDCGSPTRQMATPGPVASTSTAHPTFPAATQAIPATPHAGRRGRRRCHEDKDDGVSSVVRFENSSYRSTSGFQWSCRPQTSATTRTAARNIMPAFTPGPTPEASNADTPEKSFTLFVEDQIIDEIVTWTNIRIDAVAAKYLKRTATIQRTTAAEVRAMLGIFIFSGCQKDNHLSTKEMWNPSIGAPVYRAAMSEGRFSFLLACLRFDDPDTRQERKAMDKFAPIRKIWDIFFNNCKKFKYLLAGIPYLGKQVTQPQGGQSLGHYFTKELTKQYHQTNRNVTTDNWFTSVPLAIDLLEICGMTIVGTVKANKREIPHVMKDKENRTPGSSAFLFTKELTLVSFLPDTATKKKLVLFLSSMHTQASIGSTHKPEVIEFYNQTKGGVDTFDQMCAHYSCSRKTKRWPLCVLYGMMNAGVINSWIIHKENALRSGDTPMRRKQYMQALAMALIKPWAEQRLPSSSLSRQLRILICTVCNIPTPGTTAREVGPVAAESGGPLVRCADCPTGSDRKTQHRCHVCRRPVCPRHYYPACTDCM
ncbi:hypothetical protein SRHO_G00099080 [Serrasalmus rhombeus]